MTIETEGQMLQRACGAEGSKNIVVINDEAHHCYREKPQSRGGSGTQGRRKGRGKEKQRGGAPVDFRHRGAEAQVACVRSIDLSATPFFLRGSGYAEGTLFPWIVSDFSLMDAIECGIVKLPRVPVDDNLPSGEMPMLPRPLGAHRKAASSQRARANPATSIRSRKSRRFCRLRSMLSTAITSRCTTNGGALDIAVPPVFIVVCDNTSVSKLVYEWIAGFERLNEDGEPDTAHCGHLELFRNFDEHGNRFPRPNTLLIDSEQLESGDALDPAISRNGRAGNRAVQI